MSVLRNNPSANSPVMRDMQGNWPTNDTSQTLVTDDSVSLTSRSRSSIIQNTNTDTVTNVATTTSNSTTNNNARGAGALVESPINNDAAKASLTTKIKDLKISIGIEKIEVVEETNKTPSNNTASQSTAKCNNTTAASPPVTPKPVTPPKPVDIAKTLEAAKKIKREIVTNHINVNDRVELTKSLKPVFEFLDTTIKKDITKAKADVASLLEQKSKAESKNKPTFNNKIQEAQMKLAQLETQQLIITTEINSYNSAG